MAEAELTISTGLRGRRDPVAGDEFVRSSPRLCRSRSWTRSGVELPARIFGRCTLILPAFSRPLMGWPPCFVDQRLGDRRVALRNYLYFLAQTVRLCPTDCSVLHRPSLSLCGSGSVLDTVHAYRCFGTLLNLSRTFPFHFFARSEPLEGLPRIFLFFFGRVDQAEFLGRPICVPSDHFFPRATPRPASLRRLRTRRCVGLLTCNEMDLGRLRPQPNHL